MLLLPHSISTITGLALRRLEGKWRTVRAADGRTGLQGAERERASGVVGKLRLGHRLFGLAEKGVASRRHASLRRTRDRRLAPQILRSGGGRNRFGTVYVESGAGGGVALRVVPCYLIP